MFKIKAVMIAVLALAMASPASAQSEFDDALGYMDLLQHVTESNELLPVALDDGAEALSAWSESELGWLFSNPPHQCYSLVWGRWVQVVTLTGAMATISLSDSAVAAEGLLGSFKEVADDYVEVLADATADCTAP